MQNVCKTEYDEVTYGKQSTIHKYGVKQLTSDWQYFKETSQKTPSRDFMGINKLAIQQKKDKAMKKSFQNVAVPQKKGKPQEVTKLVKLPPSNFIYGRNSNVQNDFKEIVGGMYGLVYEFEQDQKQKHNNNSLIQLNNRQALKNIQQVNNHSQKVIPTETIADKKQFKLSRFQNIAPKTQSIFQTNDTCKTQPN